MNKTFLYLLSILSVLLYSCEEEIELDVNQTKEKLVVEGLLTDSLKVHKLKLSTTAGLYDQNGFSKVNNATISVIESDMEGNERQIHYVLTEKDGQYESELAFAGHIGFSYKLIVDWNSERFEAEDILLPVTEIDSLSAEPVDEDWEPSDELKDSLGTETGPFYWMKFYATEPSQTRDYYNWRFFRNGKMQNYQGRAVFYASDEIVREEITGIYIPGTYTIGDTVYMEQYSLSRMGYLFYFDLETVLYSDGGMFSAPPANPRTNLSNGALGFWQVSAIKTIEFIIE